MVAFRERGPSCFFLTARFAKEHGARFGRRALKRRGNQMWRRARDRAGRRFPPRGGRKGAIKVLESRAAAGG